MFHLPTRMTTAHGNHSHLSICCYTDNIADTSIYVHKIINFIYINTLRQDKMATDAHKIINFVYINTWMPWQNGRRYPDDIFKRIFLKENICIPINNSLRFFPKGQINNIPSLAKIMAWRRPRDKTLFEPMLVIFFWMTNFVFWFEFHRSLFLRVQLTICGHLFR